MTVALETINLVKRFSGIVASNNVSLQVAKGARHALIGPNGAGKTTLINLLTGVQRPTSGSILLDGEDISDKSTYERVRLGIVRTFQINQLFNDLTPLETIGLAVSERRGQGLDWWRVVGSRPDLVTEVVEILERFHLTDVIDKRTAVLPYGKQRLLEIALAIACRPRVLLLDEPAAGVPEDERHEILAAVAALPKDVTVLLIEHDMDIVFSFADRISVLVNGALFVEGSPEELQSAIDITLQRFAEYHSLQGAFGRRATIEQAKGILMARHSINSDKAFGMLREHSQHSGNKLVDVAAAIVDSHLLLIPLADSAESGLASTG